MINFLFINDSFILNEKSPINLLILFSIIFFIGMSGIIFKRANFLLTLLSIEVMYLGIISFSVLVSVISTKEIGQVYALIFLIMAACESAIGLGILIILYRFGKTLNFSNYEIMRG